MADEHGARWTNMSPSKTAMVVLPVVPTPTVHEDEEYMCTVSDTSKAMLQTASYGQVTANVRKHRASFTHDHDGLIRRVSNAMDADDIPFHIDTGTCRTVPIRWSHVKKIIPMLKTDNVRVDISTTNVTFTGDKCGIVYACESIFSDSFDIVYNDLLYIYEHWPEDTNDALELGIGGNGIIFLRGTTRRGWNLTGFMTPVQ